MPELPMRKQYDQINEDEMNRLLELVPHIASYLACCVSPEGKGASVRINITASKDTRKWGMDLVIPGELLQKFSHLSGETIPRAEVVYEMLTPQKKIEDGVVIARAEVKVPENESWLSDTPEGYIGEFPPGC